MKAVYSTEKTSFLQALRRMSPAGRSWPGLTERPHPCRASIGPTRPGLSKAVAVMAWAGYTGWASPRPGWEVGVLQGLGFLEAGLPVKVGVRATKKQQLGRSLLPTAV